MRILVTGGSGFLGSHLARSLYEQGHNVTVFSRRIPELPSQITPVSGDLRDRAAVLKACQNQEAVFHAGALTGIWGKAMDFMDINVGGTEHILDGCRQNGIRYLIYTSSPSVVYDQMDLINADESLPYPEKFLCEYSRTKALAEQKILEDNDRKGVKTVALRPHLIWGPGDTHLIPRVMDRARKGQLVQVGPGANQVDIIYIDNAVEGHIKAFEALITGKVSGGAPYFISDGQPVVLWEWLQQLIAALGIPKVSRQISYRTAWWLGWGLETLYRMLALPGEPRMTRFLAGQLSTSHYFDISRARRDLKYAPVVSPDEGLRRTVSYFQSRRGD
jgi:nucleoside-diphosphate-sugar epimerase